MSRLAVLPVRELATSKSRFQGTLDQHGRAELSKSMLLDTVEAMTASRQFDAIAILTPEPEAWGLAVSTNVQIAGTPVRGLNEALDQYTKSLDLSDRDSLSVVLPGLPSASEDDFIELSEEAGRQGSAVIVPDHHLSGTNVLSGSAPFPWRPSFGENSLNRHLMGVMRLRMLPTVLYRRGLMCDVDNVRDLMELHDKGRLRRRTEEFVEHFILEKI